MSFYLLYKHVAVSVPSLLKQKPHVNCLIHDQVNKLELFLFLAVFGNVEWKEKKIVSTYSTCHHPNYPSWASSSSQSSRSLPEHQPEVDCMLIMILKN